jgi:hypothetical protein
MVCTLMLGSPASRGVIPLVGGALVVTLAFGPTDLGLQQPGCSRAPDTARDNRKGR